MTETDVYYMLTIALLVALGNLYYKIKEIINNRFNKKC